jgi:hypothetical protein
VPVSLLFASACGSVHSSETPGEPILFVEAQLATTPDMNVDPDRLRATLVWTNGLELDGLLTPACDATSPEEILACGQALRGQFKVSSSDVQVEMTFPLKVRLAMYELPTPVVGKVVSQDENDSWPSGLYSAVPEAEVVLYEDGNGNGKLDLLPLGTKGPGPDRVVALSSGRDRDGNVVRTSIVYKQGRIWPFGDIALALEEGRDPQKLGDTTPIDGVFAVREVVGPDLPLAQQEVLTSHSLSSFKSISYEKHFTKEPIEGATIQLFPVAPDRRSWLARGCERLSLGDAPPKGADVHCGSGQLVFASHPDNYCGQAELRMALVLEGQIAPWWPCDANGLKPQPPYHASAQRLDVEQLVSEDRVAALTHGANGGPRGEDGCKPGRIYHHGREPSFRIPNVAPPPGSQVMCHSRESLSYIPPSNDGCLNEFGYDLSWKGEPWTPDFDPSWDRSASPPDWWPCQADGTLRADSGFIAPQPLPEAQCGPQLQRKPTLAPPPHSRVQCRSATSLAFMTAWSDACEPASVISRFGNEEAVSSWTWHDKPTWWPCDEQGKLLVDKGYAALTDEEANARQ